MRPLRRRYRVFVGADPCVRPNDAGNLLGSVVGTGRDLSLQAEGINPARHSGVIFDRGGRDNQEMREGLPEPRADGNAE